MGILDNTRPWANYHLRNGVFRAPSSMALAFALFTLPACTQTNPLVSLQHYLVQENAANAVTVNFCTDPAVAEDFVSKTIIILDHSGSNKENYYMDPSGDGGPLITNNTINISPAYATDPTGSLRYGNVNSPGTLLNYLATTPANDPTNPTRYFALIDFNSAVSTYPAGSSGFTSDIPAFYNYVYQDSQGNSPPNGEPVDSGDTSYIAALGAAYSIINTDIQNAQNCAQASPSTPPSATCLNPGVQVASAYNIIFMSDGSPITNISGVGVDPNGQIVVTGQISLTVQPTNQILGQVQTIMGLTSNTKYVAGVNLFTVYYYNPANNIDQAGQALLGQMAKLGGGIAYNAVSGSKLNYASFLPPVKTIKYTLSDVFVTNASVTWWSDGTLHLDSDMDGLPDDIEKIYGSDPTKEDTNGNGVGDFVEYQLNSGAPCNPRNALGICTKAPVNYAAGACSGISSQQIGGKTVFTASDPNGLNDCEKTLLSDIGGINNPDSNSDGIPDWLEFKNGVQFQLNAPSASEVTGTDGYTLYQKIKASMPTNYPINQILNLQPSQYNLTQTSTSNVQDCYTLSVTQLPIIGSGNTVRVDVVLKSELLQDRFLYRVGKKIFPPGSTSIQFNDWNNATEQAAGTWSTWP